MVTGGSPAAAVLREAGVDPTRLRELLREEAARQAAFSGQRAPDGPPTPTTATLVRLAVAGIVAERLDATEVCAEHLLLALLREAHDRRGVYGPGSLVAGVLDGVIELGRAQALILDRFASAGAASRYHRQMQAWSAALDSRLQVRVDTAKPILALDDAARFDVLLERGTALVPRAALPSLIAWARGLGIDVADLSSPPLPVLAFANREMRQLLLGSAAPAMGETYWPSFSDVTPGWPWRIGAIGDLYRATA
jgi:hypothetical protein